MTIMLDCFMEAIKDMDRGTDIIIQNHSSEDIKKSIGILQQKREEVSKFDDPFNSATLLLDYAINRLRKAIGECV